MDFTLTTLDWLWIGFYFVVIYAIAIWASRGAKSSNDYFLAGRGVPWVVIGASLFATNIGTEHLVGLAASGYERGFLEGHYEWEASLIVLVLGWVFVPFYLSSKVVTMPEFLERRYSSSCRMYLSIISILGYIFTKISVILFAGSLILEAVLGWNFWTSAIVMIVLTGIYTLAGGLKAVLYTDFVQAFILIIGAVALTLFGLHKIGGISELKALVPEGHFSMFKPMDDPRMPWTGVVFGAPILGLWYWCTDQFIVQRVLSAKGIKEAQRGTILAGYLKILPVFILMLPGVIGYALVHGQQAFTIENPNEIYPAMVGYVLPAGLRGLVIAGLLAALMSSLSSTFNSCSTLVSFDLYKRWKPAATDRELVRVGRIAVGVLMVSGLLWAPFIDTEASLFKYLQSVQAYIAPPIAAVFLFGVFVRKLNGKGAITSLLTGFVLGGFRFVVENFVQPDLEQGGFLAHLASIHFLHFAALLFLICTIILFVVSYTSPAPSKEQLEGLTFGSTESRFKPDTLNVVLSVVLVGLVLSLWAVFF